MNPYHFPSTGTILRPKNTFRQIARLSPSFASYCNFVGLGSAKGPQGYALRGFHLLGVALDVCQITRKMMNKHIGLRANVGVQSEVCPTF